jgi:hypothetical protein
MKVSENQAGTLDVQEFGFYLMALTSVTKSNKKKLFQKAFSFGTLNSLTAFKFKNVLNSLYNSITRKCKCLRIKQFFSKSNIALSFVNSFLEGF